MPFVAIRKKFGIRLGWAGREHYNTRAIPCPWEVFVSEHS